MKERPTLRKWAEQLMNKKIMAWAEGQADGVKATKAEDHYPESRVLDSALLTPAFSDAGDDVPAGEYPADLDSTAEDGAIDGEEAVMDSPGFVRDTPEGPDFRSTPLWSEDRPYDDHVDSREGTAVFDLFTAGHGFQVMAGPKTAQKRFLCRRCGTEIIRPADEWVCQFSGDVTTRPMVTPEQPCMCNWCCINADVREGRPPERCEACRLLDERDRARANREATNTRHRTQAGAAVQAHPGLDDAAIARMLKVPRVRVSEAREEIRTGN